MSRSSSMKGAIFASQAVTSVPPSPSVGVPYRNPGMTATQAGQGWPFKTIVDSAPFNEVLYRVTSLLNDLEKSGILYWSPYTDYPIGAICRDDIDGKLYESTKISGPNSGGTKQPSSSSLYWTLSSIGGGGGKNVFEIFYTLSNVVPDGAFDLSLGTLLSNADTTYPDFWAECVARKTAGTIPTKTESQWQAEVTAHGQCAAFVVDTAAKSVRLPKITDFLQGGGTLGGVNDAGLPNITGGVSVNYSSTPAFKGALSKGTTAGTSAGLDTIGYESSWLELDASKSNAIYGKSTTVQPKSANAKMWIQVVGSASGATSSSSRAVTAPDLSLTETKTVNTVYQAAVDGMVFVEGINSGAKILLSASSSMTSPLTVGNDATSTMQGYSVFVKAGTYYKAIGTSVKFVPYN